MKIDKIDTTTKETNIYKHFEDETSESMRAKIQYVLDWANYKLDSAPRRYWYQYMKMIEILDDTLRGVHSPIPEHLWEEYSRIDREGLEGTENQPEDDKFRPGSSQ